MNVPSSPIKQVGIWIRVSTEDQARGESPQHHLERAKGYAQFKGWIVAEVYDLAGVSGKSVMDHAETRRMIADVESGRISGLIFSKLARLARNTVELLRLSELFRQHNADLISIHESIDTSTPAGRLFYTMIAAMAEWEREEIADRVKASIAIRAKLHKPLNGRAPYGYYWKDKKLIPHPQEGPVRKLMYELFEQYGRKRTVARILNEKGYRTRDGSKFSDTTIGRLIQDPTAKGIHRANYTKRVASNKPAAFKPEHEWVLNPVEPLISEKLWIKCNDLLEKNKLEITKLGKRPVHLFAGLITCECGKRMYVPTNSAKYVCTACKNKIPIADLEDSIISELKNYNVHQSTINGFLEAANKELTEKIRLLEVHQKELEKVTQQADQTYRLALDGALNSKQFKELYDPLDSRKKQLQEEIPNLQGLVDVLRSNSLNEEYMRNETSNVYSNWPKMDQEQKRRFIENYIKNITALKDGGLDISYFHFPGYEEMTNKQRML